MSTTSVNSKSSKSGTEDYRRLAEEFRTRSTLQIAVESLTYGSICTAAFVGNLLVLFVVYKTPRLRRSAPGLFVTSLALSDIAMAAFATPPSLAAIIVGRWVAGSIVCQFQGFVVITVVSASLQTMALMSVDRFFRVVHPVKHRVFFTAKRAKIMAVLVWVLAAVVAFPYFVSGKKYIFHPGKFFCFYEKTVSFASCIIYIDIFASLVVLSFCYFSVFRNLRLNRKRVENLRTSLANDPTNKISAEDIRLIRTLFVTVLGYFACWTPVLIIDIIDMGLSGSSLSRGVYFMYTNIGLISSSLNPFIYGALNRTFRREYKNIVCFKKTHKQVPTRSDLTDANC